MATVQNKSKSSTITKSNSRNAKISIKDNSSAHIAGNRGRLVSNTVGYEGVAVHSISTPASFFRFLP